MSMPEIDDLIAGRYRIENKLGQGGMGVVFGVRHIGIDRQYAMKVLTPRLSMDEDYRKRFMREAKINARLKHHNVVQVYDSGTHDGLLYIVMEYLRGTPLSELLWSGGVGGLVEIIRVGKQISQALEAAHDIGLIHRDLKTDNVLVEQNEETGERRCVLLDFGLAFMDESGELGRLTRESDNNVAGTPLYMSPEQISAAPLTPATDIYSLGCMMYELLTGVTPFEGGDDATVIKVMTRHMFKAPEPIRHKVPDIPIPLEQLVMNMLAKDPALRPTATQSIQLFEEVEHLPATGRGGVVQDRATRQVQEATRKDANQQLTTARFFGKKGKEKQPVRSVGLWGLQVDEEHQLSLASAGFEVHSVETQEELDTVDFLLVGLVPLKDIEALARSCAVVLFVGKGDVVHAAEYLRAGVLDVIPHDAGLEELNQRLERVYKRILRAKRRQKHSREKE